MEDDRAIDERDSNENEFYRLSDQWVDQRGELEEQALVEEERVMHDVTESLRLIAKQIAYLFPLTIAVAILAISTCAERIVR